MARLYKDNDISFAGDYRLSKVFLYSYLGNPIEISDLVQELQIYESLYSHCITGRITFTDAEGLMVRTPIIGKEHLEFKLRTPYGYNNEYGGEYDAVQHMFAVCNVSTKQPAGDQAQLVTLEFMSPEGLRDSRLRVSRAFNGTYDGAVDAMVKEPWGLNSKKPLFIEPCSFNQKYVVPNIHPLSAIKRICSRAISSKTFSPGYFFWETSAGFNFRSLDSMFMNYNNRAGVDTQWEFNVESAYKTAPEHLKAHPMQLLQRVYKVGFENNFDQLINARLGAFSSKLIAHDSFYKTFQEQEFNYGVMETYQSMPHLEFYGGGRHHDIASSIVPNVPADLHEDGYGGKNRPRFATDYTSGATLLESDTTNIHEDMEEASYHTQLHSQKRRHILHLLESIKITLEVPGNTHLNAGQVVAVTIPAYTTELHEKEGKKIPDKFLSGRWLITDIKHTVIPKDQSHRTLLTLSKETFGYPLNTTFKRPTQALGKGESFASRLEKYASGSINIKTGATYESIKAIAAKRVSTIKDGVISKIANDINYKGISINKLKEFSLANLKSYAATKLRNIVNFKQVIINRAKNTIKRSVIKGIKSIFTGGGGGPWGPTGWFSDIRLKEDIELVGQSPSGINIYNFKYKGEDGFYQGVMAQEVPWAREMNSAGYYMVDYSKVDVAFRKL
jgi:hypothetical protein